MKNYFKIIKDQFLLTIYFLQKRKINKFTINLKQKPRN